jgi:enoyl-[acyl-carrier-protein] reductase (NADH)
LLRLIFDGGGASSGTNLYADCLYRTAAFWKEASMAKALQWLGFVNLKDIANASIYLLSNASRWITGSYLVVDGGYATG